MEHPLCRQLIEEKGDRLKRGKSWLGQAEDIQQVCGLNGINLGAEWTSVPSGFRGIFSLPHSAAAAENRTWVWSTCRPKLLLAKTPVTQTL